MILDDNFVSRLLVAYLYKNGLTSEICYSEDCNAYDKYKEGTSSISIKESDFAKYYEKIIAKKYDKNILSFSRFEHNIDNYMFRYANRLCG